MLTGYVTNTCRAGVCKGGTAELWHQLQLACGDSAADPIPGLGQRSAAVERHCKPHPGHYFTLHVGYATCPYFALLAMTGLSHAYMLLHATPSTYCWFPHPLLQGTYLEPSLT